MPNIQDFPIMIAIEQGQMIFTCSSYAYKDNNFDSLLIFWSLVAIQRPVSPSDHTAAPKNIEIYASSIKINENLTKMIEKGKTIHHRLEVIHKISQLIIGCS